MKENENTAPERLEGVQAVASAYDNSIENAYKKAEKFNNCRSLSIYGWVENEMVVGVCGFKVYDYWVRCKQVLLMEGLMRFVHKGWMERVIAFFESLDSKGDVKSLRRNKRGNYSVRFINLTADCIERNQ